MGERKQRVSHKRHVCCLCSVSAKRQLLPHVEEFVDVDTRVSARRDGLKEARRAEEHLARAGVADDLQDGKVFQHEIDEVHATHAVQVLCV